MTALKIERFDKGLGVLIPADKLAQFGLAEGDELVLVKTPAGVRLTSADVETRAAIDAGRDVARRYPETLRRLSE